MVRMMSNNNMQTSPRGNCLDDATPVLEFLKTGKTETLEISKQTELHSTLKIKEELAEELLENSEKLPRIETSIQVCKHKCY